MPALFRLAAASLLAAALLSPAHAAEDLPPLQPAAKVDLERYMGRWYVLANIPYFAERGKVGAYAEYRPRDDGRVDDLYYARDGSFEKETELTEGIGWVVDTDSNARWKVQFYWPVTADYLILYVSDDYRYALIGHPSRDYAWIFAREPEIPEWTYAGLLARLAAHHYDVSRLRRVPQMPEQVGEPGFQ